MCRWSTWDAVKNGEEPRSDIDSTIQEEHGLLQFGTAKEVKYFPRYKTVNTQAKDF